MTCFRCGEPKDPIKDFHKDGSGKRKKTCKDCFNRRSKQLYHEAKLAKSFVLAPLIDGEDFFLRLANLYSGYTEEQKRRVRCKPR